MCKDCDNSKCVKICSICGLGECKHHDFVPYVVPKGCVCDVRSWGDPSDIQPVCDHYESELSEQYGYCKNCEHDYECHAESKEQTKEES